MANTNVVVGPVRFSYAHVFEPKVAPGSTEPKFSVAVLIPKSNMKALAEVEEAVKAALEAGKAKTFGGAIPKNVKLPLRDGDEERPNDPVYKGMWFFNASAKRQPGVVGKDRKPLLSEEDFYSGCWGYVDANFYAFNTNGNKGVAAGLNNLMKTKDDERLSGAQDAETAFKAVEVDDEDMFS